MKATENSITTNTEKASESVIKTRVIPTISSRAKSIRPQKSMVRLQSFKPKRLNIATKVTTKKV